MFCSKLVSFRRDGLLTYLVQGSMDYNYFGAIEKFDRVELQRISGLFGDKYPGRQRNCGQLDQLEVVPLHGQLHRHIGYEECEFFLTLFSYVCNDVWCNFALQAFLEQNFPFHNHNLFKLEPASNNSAHRLSIEIVFVTVDSKNQY